MACGGLVCHALFRINHDIPECGREKYSYVRYPIRAGQVLYPAIAVHELCDGNNLQLEYWDVFATEKLGRQAMGLYQVSTDLCAAWKLPHGYISLYLSSLLPS